MNHVLEPVHVESSLPERQMVWCLESDFVGRLCIRRERGLGYIMVFHSESDALGHLQGDTWQDHVQKHALRVIELSLESVTQHAKEQGANPVKGYPTVGYVWMPDCEFVEVSK